jgi:hypothetical protein
MVVLAPLPRTPQSYRQQAEHCERLAAEATFGENRETLLYVAAQWRSFADEDEAQPGDRRPIGSLAAVLAITRP